MPAPGAAVDRRPSFQPFQCLVCQSRFTRHENLKRHAALHTRSHEEASLPCDFCQATFSRPDLRNRHMKRKHPEHDDRRAKKRPQRECRSASSPRQLADPTNQSHPDQGPFVSPVSIAEHGRGSNRSQSSEDGDMDTEVVGSWQSTSHFTTRRFDHPDTAQLATSIASSASDDGIHITGRPIMSNSLNPSSGISPGLPDSSSLSPNILLAAPFVGPTDRFDTPMQSINMPQHPSFGTDMNAFAFDQDLPDGLLSMDLSQIQDDWAPSAMQVTRGCELYFSHVSHFVPFLHQPTFNPAQSPSHLLLSMLCLAYQHGEDPENGNRPGSGQSLSVRCFRRARMLIACDDERTTDLAHSIAMVQAYLLLQIYAMMYLCGNDSAYGLKTHSKMISLSRAGGLMQPTLVESATTTDLDALWHQFIRAESHKRTAFAVHQIDALWYQFLSVPRSLSHLEIKHELPCPEDFWAAASSVEWAHRQLVSRGSSSTLLQYSEAVRRFLSDTDLSTMPAFGPYGAINITQFLISSAREVSGWSTMSGRLSMERLEPLKSSLVALSPFIRPGSEPATPHAMLCEATWQTAMIEMQMWSPSHTGGIVESSMDAVLQQLTYLAPSCDFLCESNMAKTMQPHVDWFLRYLDSPEVAESEAPWITLYAYKAFMIAWQLVRGSTLGSMQAVGVEDGDVEGALAWARKVFKRRERWQLGRIILSCLDTLDK